MKTVFSTVLVCSAGLASAGEVMLERCARTTHISHAGESAHRDLGMGRVIWHDWWAQEGTATDIFVVDCVSGAGLRARVAEANMTADLPFDKTDRALRSVETVHAGARAFATFDRLQEALERDARAIQRIALTAEPCACAALYPDARGDKTAFEFENLPSRAGLQLEDTQ